MGRFAFNAKPMHMGKPLECGNLRLTVLTPCLVRLETEHFTDMPTQTVWNRDLGETEYSVEKHRDTWTVKTEEAAFCVDVSKGIMRSITPRGQTVVTDFEKGNLLGTARTLDMVNGGTKLEKGVLSRSGVSVLDDSKSLLLQQDGRILPRPCCTDRYYFAYGRDYRRCLRDFFRLTGPVPLIPKFALGNWWSRYRAYTQEEYRSLMREFLNRKLPVTVATIDMDWHWTDVLQRFGEEAKPAKPRNRQERHFNRFLPGWTGYSWNTELFPDHQELLDWLHANQFHVTLNVHPSQGIRFFEDCYEDVCCSLEKDPAKKELVPFDVSDTKFMEAYFDAVHHPLEAEGVDFWWLDWQQGTNSAIPGLDPLWALNHYHTLDSARGEKRPMTLSRYAGLGSHRYPLGFSGDTFCTWKSLDFQPYFTNNAANAGYTWWSHDIGGHQQGQQDDELYLRWLQYGVFSPINRLHSSNSDFMGKEPWKRCYSVNTVAQDYLRLRHKLIPYLYSANYQTHTAGIPICEPMYYTYDREEAYQVKNQYMFGTQLMVCPITSPADKRLNLASVRVWLPEGRWTDFFNGRIYRGGQWVTMYRDIHEFPVLAPQGAIVPMYVNGDTNDLSLEQPMEVNVWRGNGRFDLYEDDGETKAYADGKYAITTLEVEERGDVIRFTIHAPEGDRSVLPACRSMQIRFRDVVRAEVTVNGEQVENSDAFSVTVPVTVTGEQVEILLTNWVAAVNKPKIESTGDLLTRVQGSNLWKMTRFPSSQNQHARMPKFVKAALKEFEVLWDEKCVAK